MTEQEIKQIIDCVVDRYINAVGGNGGSSVDCTKSDCSSAACSNKDGSVMIEASARHVHLTKEAVEKLFGAGEKLNPVRPLSQPGQFLSDKRVKLVTNKGVIDNVAVLGPERSKIQVELSLTDSRQLGLKPPIKMSGDLDGAGDVYIFSEKSMIEAKSSVIVAKAHIHMRPEDAECYGVSDNQHVKVRVDSERPVIFDDVVIRVDKNFAPAMHVDFDEANACCLSKSAKAYILK
ncbi:MAG: phosphate propanoyltransferase [Clostridiales bacterium]|nr:phosphate propanoyltransferase [Clostridiales bacterium]